MDRRTRALAFVVPGVHHTPVPPPDLPERTVAQLVVEQLEALGADLAFGVPGESYLSVLDAMVDARLRYVTCRQEGGAAFAADAHAKLTGRPGVLMVTRGPGVLNAAIGLHTAQQDDTPLVCLVGLIPRHQRGRDAFQEIDLQAVFGTIAKWVHVLDVGARAPEVIARAWHLALAGRPGPVVVGLPEDILDEVVRASIVAPTPVASASVDAATLAEVHGLIERSARPAVIVGGSRWTDRAIAQLPEAFPGIPLVTAFRRQDLVDHRHEQFAGWLGLGASPDVAQLVRDADVLVVVGDRLDDPTTSGFTLLDIAGGGPTLVHIHPDPHELGRVHLPRVAIAADPASFLAAWQPCEPSPDWAERTRAARTAHVVWREGGGEQERIARGLREVLGEDAIVTNGAGNFARPLQRGYKYRRPGRQLAPLSGAMGYGVPAAVAAKLTHPDRSVVCIVGDGELMMTCQELATAAREHLGITVLVIDNAEFGTIRTHQERRFPGRRSGTALTNPDFVRLAESFGAIAVRTSTAEETIAALARSVAMDRLALVHYTGP